jgi:hypothetical protein
LATKKQSKLTKTSHIRKFFPDPDFSLSSIADDLERQPEQQRREGPDARVADAAPEADEHRNLEARKAYSKASAAPAVEDR